MPTEFFVNPMAAGPANRSTSMGSRSGATPTRKRIETSLRAGEKVALNFDGVEVTQSFVDELIGLVVLAHGPEVLKMISFRKCSPDVKAIVNFVVRDRAQQFSTNATRA